MAERAQLVDVLRGAQARAHELLGLFAHERHQLLSALVVETCAKEMSPVVLDRRQLTLLLVQYIHLELSKMDILV